MNRRPASWIYYFDSAADEPIEGDEELESLEIPADLSDRSITSDDDLTRYETELVATFQAIRASENLSSDDLAELRTINASVKKVREEIGRRSTEAAALLAEADQLEVDILAADTESTTPDEAAAEDPAPAAPAEVPAPAEAETVTAAAPAPLVIRRPRLNVPLSEVQRRAPDPELNPRTEALVIAAPDVPSIVAGSQLDNLDHVAEAMHRRAKTLANPSGSITVATIRREFDIVLDREAAPEKIWDIMRRAADPQHLVAAGGWCAPSSIIYDFFNIACDDGILDVPTVGVTRGGIRFPVSPSIADALDDIWIWTEGDDIAAATGAGTKPCVRVPCPTFNEERLDCHGLCITAGNLTESAYPELISNYLRLVMAAHRHVINQRIIADIVAQSTAVAVTGTDMTLTTHLLGAIGLQASDYREKFRMCDDDVLEVVLPRWAKEAVRSDIAKRTGVDMLAVTDSQMMEWFDLRKVRVQFVSDWQVGTGDFPGQTAARTAWPANLQFLIYAAGTFVVGNGLDLDLGVVRDSTLNAKNDHTAAWTEECKLVAKIGHESRIVTLDYAVDGNTGAANLDGLAMV
jgi:hypothetical protein